MTEDQLNPQATTILLTTDSDYLFAKRVKREGSDVGA
jgi:hypothetical protein